MSYDAKVFNVMIASPGDVEAERKIIRDTIYTWNNIHSKKEHIVLAPLAWESHTTPEMGDHPQQIINRQLLADADLLIAVFGTRLGTSTVDFSSGTVEEIERHMEAGKPVMLYFSDRAVKMSGVDTNQWEELKKFKTYCQDKGLYGCYEDYQDFERKLLCQLQLKVNDHPIFKGCPSPQIADLKQDAKLVEEKAKILASLSAIARIVLKNASQNLDGTIMCSDILRNQLIPEFWMLRQDFLGAHPSKIGRLNAAMHSLGDNGLIEKVKDGNAVPRITALGYEIADMIDLPNPNDSKIPPEAEEVAMSTDEKETILSSFDDDVFKILLAAKDNDAVNIDIPEWGSYSVNHTDQQSSKIKWKNGIEVLREKGFLEAVPNSNERFRITARGAQLFP